MKGSQKSIVSLKSVVVLLVFVVILLTALLVQQYMLLTRKTAETVTVEKESVSFRPTTVPTTLPTIAQGNTKTQSKTNVQKENEISAIDQQVEAHLAVQSEDIALMKTATDSMKECTSEWCYETLIQQAKDIQANIDERSEKIEALKLQRSILVAGL